MARPDFFDIDNNDTCRSFTHENLTQFGNIYEGIPETLFLNLVTWVLLMLLFAILRNRAWDYGRLALVQNERWTQLFYKTSSNSQLHDSGSETLLTTDVGCRWIPTIFMINKQKIFARCGPDALHYLSFQQHLLFLMGIITIISICVILPINFQGNLQGTVNTFGHTTISNLESTSSWLWVHIVTALSFVPLTILIMRRCSSHMPSATLVSSRTIMITNISHPHRNAEDIKNYLSYCFPNLIEIKDIQIAYKIKKLMHVEDQRIAAQECLMYCVANKASNIKVQKRGCVVCCRCNLEDAELYYLEMENELNALVREERRVALERPLGICFVTLETEEQAKYVVEKFVPGTLRKWNMWKAPSPSDINWENLQISMRYWYSKAIIINFLLFIVLFFLTTPAVVVSTFNIIANKDNFIDKISPIFSEFLPTLILLTMSALMPVIVAYTDQWMSHWTKSKQNLATMNKTFIFLLFMVLILPSLGLTSAQAFVEWSIQNKNRTLRWECIFLSDKGAFFVNYVITSALIGTGLELLRFPELAMYIWRLLWMKSKAETVTIRKQILSIFPFGIHYSWTLLIFTVSTAYSLICPLITPFGLLYLSLKHLVDKHNIYYVYKPITMSEEGHQIHSSAVRLVRVGVMLLQMVMAAFATIRGGFSLMAIITILGLFASFGLFFMLSPFPSCRPKQRCTHDAPGEADTYVAPVLVTSEQISPISVISNQNGYGSSTVTDDEIILSRPGSSLA